MKGVRGHAHNQTHHLLLVVGNDGRQWEDAKEADVAGMLAHARKGRADQKLFQKLDMETAEVIVEKEDQKEERNQINNPQLTPQAWS